MKSTIFSSGLFVGLLWFSHFSFAQCSDCVADLNCVGVDGFPAVCPAVADTAYTNAYYEEFLTFYIPTQVTDPGSGLDATLLSVEVVSVAGLPFGLEFTLSDADGIFYPSQGENYGCATICGTPLIQGVYDVQIAVDIVAEAFGFEITQSESFPYTIVVEPGEGGTGSFTYNGTAGCGALNVAYEAILAAPLPSVTTYEWDFGNQQTSNESAPSEVLYDLPGTYNCQLTTTIYDYKLNGIATSALSDNWSGDIDDVFSVSDTYFTLTDGSGNTVFSSDVLDNNNTPAWQNLNILLSNPPYTVTFYDEDDISADDNLGNVSIALQEGTYDFDNTSGTAGQITVLLEETTSVTDSVEISVFEAPVPVFDITATQLIFNDPDLTTFQWYLNGTPLIGETASQITLDAGGEYDCMVTNIYGCSALSNAYLFCPDLTPTYDALAEEVFVEQGFSSYQWFFNGASVDGANNYYYNAATPGNYSVLITTSYGCTTLSEVITVTLDVQEKNAPQPALIGNPVTDHAVIQHITPGALCKVLDAHGRLMASFVASTNPMTLDTKEYPTGIYHIKIQHQNQYIPLKLIKQ
jgi:hypothetical protein